MYTFTYINIFSYIWLYCILGESLVSSCVSNVAERDASSKHTIRLDEKQHCFFGLACALLEATVNVHTYCYFKHVQPMSQAQAGAVVSLIFWGKIEIAVGVSNTSHRQAPSPGWNASLRSSEVVCIGGYVEETSVKSSDLFHTHWMLSPQKLFTLNILSLSGPLRLETAFPYIST